MKKGRKPKSLGFLLLADHIFFLKELERPKPLQEVY
jgi:hypothetical protein